tara:strand:+ start:747 stop:1274 length:528 start_codon:yes stop_codon:yes gene_type:complete
VKHIDKPSNKNTIFEDGQWWYVGSKDERRRTVESHNKKNTNRMFVNGEYIPQSHPLHKGGRYKGFEEAAFSSLENYKTNPQGQVYIISNPAWEGWVKVGMAVDAQDRLKNYQTSSPLRDFQLLHVVNTPDRRKLEADVHNRLSDVFDQKNEWFKCSPDIAKRFIDSAIGDHNEQA